MLKRKINSMKKPCSDCGQMLPLGKLYFMGMGLHGPVAICSKCYKQRNK